MSGHRMEARENYILWKRIKMTLILQIIETHNVRHTDGWTNKRNYHDNKIVGE